MIDRDDAERFFAKVNKIPGGCWIWTAGKRSTGYGGFWSSDIKNKVLSHRWSYEYHTRKDPGPLCVCHKCDEPLCVNPDHLFTGNHQDNMRDMIEKNRGRGQFKKGENHSRSVLNNTDVLHCRQMYKPRDPERGISAMARKMGVNKYTLAQAIRGVNWSHLTQESPPQHTSKSAFDNTANPFK